MQADYILLQKSNLRQIKISEITFTVPDLKNIDESKAMAVSKWLISWIETDLKRGLISVNDLLPQKSELAYFLGVSAGTIQNSLRYLEDLGYVESKQRLGTMVKDRSSRYSSTLRKLTSKREVAISEIKRFIINNKLKSGSTLPSARTLSTLVGCSPNTTRLALEYLGVSGILSHNKENGWEVSSSDFDKKSFVSAAEPKTLVDKVEKDLKSYINKNLKAGDKLPAHAELSSILKVSNKTIHDAMKTLINEGILLARRGRYGTIVLNLPKDIHKSHNRLETSIFAPAKDTAFYYYEKTQNEIKKMIAEHYGIGSKLPSILELSKEMDLSPNTVRKAFHNLAKDGYLAFSRGRYGGTFVVDIPSCGIETFKWLAVNPQYSLS